jgi:hypothetical protein
MVGEYSDHPTHHRTGDHTGRQLGLPVFVIERYQRSKARYPKKVQLTEVEDQRSLPPREPADCFTDPIGIGCVNFATDANDRGDVMRVHPQSGPSTIE